MLNFPSKKDQRKGLPRPSLRLLKVTIVWMGVGALYPLLGLPQHMMFQGGLQAFCLIIWGLLGGFYIVLAIWDLIWIRFWAPVIDAQRQLPSRFAVGEWNKVTVEVHHNSPKTIEVYMTDYLPPTAEFRALPASIELVPGSHSRFEYQVRPTKRGELLLEKLQLLYYSRLQFWLDTVWIERPVSIKVYPNFMVLHHYELELALKRVDQLGARKRRPRGQGSEFHQLRHFQSGDALRQIDWKATSRHNQLISKSYQIERDQCLLFLLDCGRRMRVRDGELSHFDYAMKSVLLLSYVALRQGDSVGLLTFGGEERWLPPGKSDNHINRMLNTLYDLDAAPVASDYLMAAKSVLKKQKRRALIVLVSNVRDENLDELVPALRLLQQRNSVLMANLREQALDQLLSDDVSNFDQALRYAGASHYLQQRRTAHECFMAENISAIESLPEHLPTALVNHYKALTGAH